MLQSINILGFRIVGERDKRHIAISNGETK